VRGESARTRERSGDREAFEEGRGSLWHFPQ